MTVTTDELNQCIARLNACHRGRPAIQRAATQDVRIPRDLLNLTIGILETIVIQRRETDERQSRTTVAGP